MRATANGIEIEYDTFGCADNPAVLLVMGLGCQMTLWEAEFCEMLADRRCYVIRFDNRDVGLSTWFDADGVPDIGQVLGAVLAGGSVDVPYLLTDMAGDAVGLLDALGIEAACVVGASMGGMIAQTMAIRHPDRVKSLVSIMSETSDRAEPRPEAEVLARLMAPPVADRGARIEQSVETWRILCGPVFPFREEQIRARVTRDDDRAFHPHGTARQLAAILASGSRREALGGLEIPALVIHGDADPLIPVGCGRITAEAIPDATYWEIEGMGHHVPMELSEYIAIAIADLATR